ncbi:hypothetical protein CDAR_186401 [Caerostris darwini]|uniref:Uncharacterized protein n=1 Tax=Caerostris darwini TaxID=1538125 RepID=A0AAV4V138_9ARAC|nr:hypothetical protein CDAR_186401 [Caerostris darwini]
MIETGVDSTKYFTHPEPNIPAAELKPHSGSCPGIARQMCEERVGQHQITFSPENHGEKAILHLFLHCSVTSSQPPHPISQKQNNSTLKFSTHIRGTVFRTGTSTRIKMRFPCPVSPCFAPCLLPARLNG